jgi:hypothetical protein
MSAGIERTSIGSQLEEVSQEAKVVLNL